MFSFLFQTSMTCIDSLPFLIHLSFLTVNWTLSLTNAYLSPTFSPSTSSYTSSSPCAQFNASTWVDTSNCAQCTATINGGTSSASFPTLNTPPYTATLAYPGAPTLTYTSAVAPFSLSLDDVLTYPGGANLNFDSNVSNYSVITGFSTINVTTYPSSNGGTLINGVSTTSTELPVSSSASAISVQLISGDFGCPYVGTGAGPFYINTMQGIVGGKAVFFFFLVVWVFFFG
jgi:hypothetical protein